METQLFFKGNLLQHCVLTLSKGLYICLPKEKIAPRSRHLTFLFLQQESRPVQMMCQNSTFKMAAVAAEKMKILELPYASGELSMLVLLPDDVSGLEQVWPWQGKQKSYHFSGTWLPSGLLLSIYIPVAHTMAVLGRKGSTKAPQVLPGAQAETGLLGEPWTPSNKAKVKERSAAVALQNRMYVWADMVLFMRRNFTHLPL